jgi:hypothetical protein
VLLLLMETVGLVNSGRGSLIVAPLESSQFVVSFGGNHQKLNPALDMVCSSSVQSSLTELDWTLPGILIG